jgi:hypothetical protein
LLLAASSEWWRTNKRTESDFNLCHNLRKGIVTFFRAGETAGLKNEVQRGQF